MRVKIPTQLRDVVGGHPELKFDDASSVGELLQRISADYPELAERILDEQGEIRRFVNVYVGDEDVRFLDGLQTSLEGDTVVSILPAVAGGD
jgi:molybdopterin synthase sulfur carrier subunit